MSSDTVQKLEASLWEAADQLRANSKKTSSEYCMPLLGIIFLRHATNRYNDAARAIAADQAAGRMAKRPATKADFIKRRALLLPVKARYDTILALPKGSGLGKAVVEAMDAIEEQFEPLKGQLPREYEQFDEGGLLEDILRIFDRAELRSATGDVFGRIYEYFLMKFAIQGAQDNGEFFTPPSLVQAIVNVIEPNHGIVLDPACGSGGMFVQTSHFIETTGKDTSHQVTFYGQEKTGTTIRLTRMNLAVHGLEGDIQEANTFYQDVRKLVGRCDFVMANPPFNVDMVDAGKIKGDPRLPFGLPGTNKEKKVSNGNYLWISYFHSYLGPKGRAGFVMSSQASSAGHGESEIRRKLVETGDIDVMIAIRQNFFYTRPVPCELWHFDRAKPKQRRDQVLMIDARKVFRIVTRKIYDFSPEQLANLTAIVWLYRGEHDRFLGLVKRYVEQLCAEGVSTPAAVAAFDRAVKAVLDTVDGLALELTRNDVSSGPTTEALNEALGKFREAWRARKRDAAPGTSELSAYVTKYTKEPAGSNKAQHTAREAFDPIADGLRRMIKEIEGVGRLGTKAGQAALELAKVDVVAPFVDRTAVRKRLREIDEVRAKAVEQLRRVVYFHRQIGWLHERFPEARMEAVLGLCRVVTRADIEAGDWSLTPGRYVGIAAAEVDEDFDFEQTMRDIHAELAELDQEATSLAARIQTNLTSLGV
jgi:type I restriction enzyme M protein